MSIKRLSRSSKERVIGGVAGGLAEYFEVDVVLVRLLWVLAAFVGGGGVLAYIIAWIIIPEDTALESGPRTAAEGVREPRAEENPQDASYHAGEHPGTENLARSAVTPAEGQEQEAASLPEQGSREVEEEHRARRRRNAGLLLVGLGLIFLARQVLPAYFYQFSWPLLLILLGLFFLLRDRKESP